MVGERVRSKIDTDKIVAAIAGLVDRGDKLIDIFLKGGIAWAGYQSMKHPIGAVVGLLGLNLARGDNLAGGAAGVTILASIGVSNLAQAAALVQSQTPTLPTVTTQR